MTPFIFLIYLIIAQMLFVYKLCIGILVHSISVMADAFNNLSDAASSIIGFVGVKMAEKPADDDHPFGHGRIEYIAAFIVAFLVIQVGFSLFKTSFGKVLHPEDMSFRWISILILLMSVGIKLWLSCFNRKLGKRINSKVMLATSADALGDVATTSATICSIGSYGALGLKVDCIVGLIVSVVVMIAGVNIAKDTPAPLIGEAIDPEIYDKITSFVESFDGIVGSHDLIVHNYGPGRVFVTLHAEVPYTMNLLAAHDIIDIAEHRVAGQLHCGISIHMDPVVNDDKEVEELKEMVLEVIAEIDDRLSIHDFRSTKGPYLTNLIFDLVVPHQYKYTDKEVQDMVHNAIQKKNPKCFEVVTVERSYIK